MKQPTIRKMLQSSALALIAIALISCSAAARHGLPLSSTKLFDSIQTFVDSTGARTVTLVPMLHSGKQSEYKKVRDYLDTLKNHGYVTFSETLYPSDKFTDTLSIPLFRDMFDLYYPNDLAETETLFRKVRKLFGMSFHEQSLKYTRMGKTTDGVEMLMLGDRDYWVDETFADFIKEFEERYGEITLSPYDLECPLDSDKYKGKEDKRWQSLRKNSNYCNQRLAKCVLESDYDKIAVIYGYSHIHYLQYFVLPKNGYKQKDNPYYQ